MRTYDLSPLFRATVGFDRLASLLESAGRGDEQALSYPPYNIEKLSEDQYRISMAVAGFGEGDLDITVKESSLVVTGKKTKTEETGNPETLKPRSIKIEAAPKAGPKVIESQAA